MRRINYLILMLLLIVFLLLPTVASQYTQRVIINLFMYVIIVQAINVITGFAGYAALGNVVFFGVGAYLAALGMLYLGVGILPSLLIAGVGSALFAYTVGMLILKTKGHYFAMATIALNEATRELVANLEITGGGRGLSVPLLDWDMSFTTYYFYYLTFFIVILCMYLVKKISEHKLGLGLMAIKAEEDAASAMGIDVRQYKSFAWSFSAFFTGITGGIYAIWTGFIEPTVVFDIMISIKALLMLLLGGIATLFGPIWGVAIVIILEEQTWRYFPELHLGVLGLLLILITLLIPGGIAKYISPGRSGQAKRGSV